jgi:hypothetical protein
MRVHQLKILKERNDHQTKPEIQGPVMTKKSIKLAERYRQKKNSDSTISSQLSSTRSNTPNQRREITIKNTKIISPNKAFSKNHNRSHSCWEVSFTADEIPDYDIQNKEVYFGEKENQELSDRFYEDETSRTDEGVHENFIERMKKKNCKGAIEVRRKQKSKGF